MGIQLGAPLKPTDNILPWCSMNLRGALIGPQRCRKTHGPRSAVYIFIVLKVRNKKNLHPGWNKNRTMSRKMIAFKCNNYNYPPNANVFALNTCSWLEIKAFSVHYYGHGAYKIKRIVIIRLIFCMQFYFVRIGT